MNNSQENLRSKKDAGVLVPLFALRGEDDLGVGDVHTLRGFLDWAKVSGFSFVQILPINETASDNSPYNSISSCALEPLTIDTNPRSLVDLLDEDYEEIISIYDLNGIDRDRVDYQSVRHLKMIILGKSFNNFWENHYHKGTKRGNAFQNFSKKESDWLLDYCIFKYLMDEEGGINNWTKWEGSYSDIRKARYVINANLSNNKVVETEKRLAFYAYIQFIAHEQWLDVSKYAKEIGMKLMGDVPFGINYYSSDFFANPQIFIHDWFGGAPPEENFDADEFTKKWGQNWGIPIYYWREMKKTNYKWWRRRISKVCNYFDMFRIDHALGFFRIFAFPWRPEVNEEFLGLSDHEVWEKTKGRLPKFLERSDEDVVDAEKNRIRGLEILKIIKESAGKANVIAEDLGMVPHYVRPSLDSLNISGMIVPQWERSESNSLVSKNDYKENSFAIYVSHDHDTIGTQWDNLRDIILNSKNYDEVEEAKNKLITLYHIIDYDIGSINKPPAFSSEINDKFIKNLLESNSRYICFSMPDILCSNEKFNSPGTISKDNWSQRLHVSIEDLLHNEDMKYRSSQLKVMLSDSGRLNMNA